MTIILSAAWRSSLAHTPLVKTPLVGRASALFASEATRFVFVHLHAITTINTTTLFIITPHAFSLAMKRFPRLTVEAISSRGLTPQR